MAQEMSLDDPNLERTLSKRDNLEKIGFEASMNEGVQAVFKAGDDFVIWGPASVEVVDKEGDKISVEALGDALPQLLRRASLSLDHTDQIVGRILERFETQSPVTVEINGNSYQRSEFPTEVLDLDDDEPPALYVAGEIFEDTQQSKRARERIEEGELTSYSISGEALVTQKKVENGVVYDDIKDMDLSAVTLCEEGMNRGASYAQVGGEVENKELAGEAREKQDVEETPVLEHPSTSGVGTAQTAEASVSKNMSENESDEGTEEKTTGLTVDDVSKAVDQALPEGDLATVSKMKSVVEDEVESQVEAQLEEFKQNYGPGDANVDAPGHDGNYGPEGSGNSPANSETNEAPETSQAEDSNPSAPESNSSNTTGGDREPDQGNETQDYSGVETTSAKEDEEFEKSSTLADARDKIADELGVDPSEVNAKMTDLLQAGDYEDDEMDDEDEDEDEYEDEMEMEDDEEPEMPEPDDDEEEDEDEGDGMPDEVMDRLKQQLPEDVFEVVQEYMKSDDVDDMDDLEDAMGKSPAEFITDDETDGPEGDLEDVEKSVEDIISGGAEVNGASAVPTSSEEDTVGKQYSDVESESQGTTERVEESPALQPFY